jgi:hypothetical protein
VPDEVSVCDPAHEQRLTTPQINHLLAARAGIKAHPRWSHQRTSLARDAIEIALVSERMAAAVLASHAERHDRWPRSVRPLSNPHRRWQMLMQRDRTSHRGMQIRHDREAEDGNHASHNRPGTAACSQPGHKTNRIGR